MAREAGPEAREGDRADRPGGRSPKKPRRGKAHGGINGGVLVKYPNAAGWLRWVSKALERRGFGGGCPSGGPPAGSETSRGCRRAARLARRSPRSKAPKGEPQTRDRDGTSPAGLGGSKASRGCETLRAQPFEPCGVGAAGRGAPPHREHAIGDETSEGASQSRAAGLFGDPSAAASSRRSSGETLQGSQSLREESPIFTDRRAAARRPQSRGRQLRNHPAPGAATTPTTQRLCANPIGQ
jgi:hypothetical protein